MNLAVYEKKRKAHEARLNGSYNFRKSRGEFKILSVMCRELREKPLNVIIPHRGIY